jgi:hypothetical protein
MNQRIKILLRGQILNLNLINKSLLKLSSQCSASSPTVNHLKVNYLSNSNDGDAIVSHSPKFLQVSRLFTNYASVNLYLNDTLVKAIIDTGFFNSYCQTFNVGVNKQNVSAQIPSAIYNNSYYSLICETHDHDWFLTEKTAKPLIAQRPFIMFGGHHHLAFLRQLGFHTFDQIIDESYDSEPNKFLRHKQAFAQAIELSKMNPRHVYDVLSDALEHNRRLINSDDLMIPVKDWLFNKLADF